jgi:hypothetical protein
MSITHPFVGPSKNAFVRLAVVLSLSALGTGCRTRNVDLAHFKSATLKPGGPFGLNDTEVALTTVIDFDQCDLLNPDVEATENGRTLTMTSPGGPSTSVKGRLVGCEAAEFNAVSLVDAGEGVTVFELSDSSAKIHAEYPAIHGVRTATPEVDGDRYPGDQIVMDWAPVTDRIFVLTDAGYDNTPSAYISYHGDPQSYLELPDGGYLAHDVNVDIQVREGKLVVTLPNNASPGDADLRLSVITQVSATRCDGPATCGDYSAGYDVAVPIHIVAR